MERLAQRFARLLLPPSARRRKNLTCLFKHREKDPSSSASYLCGVQEAEYGVRLRQTVMTHVMRRKRRWWWVSPSDVPCPSPTVRLDTNTSQRRLTQSICSCKLMVAEKDASVDDAEIPVGSQVR